MEKKEIDKVARIIMANLNKMTAKTWGNCFKDKASVLDVSEKDWQDSSFTFEELVNNIKQDLLKL